MRNILLVFKAEIEKQHKHNYHSYFVYFSLLLWPILGFLEVYFTYKPFSLEGNAFHIKSFKELLAFLSTGYMAYTCFWSMVQNAWSMSYQERVGGTLEISFLSPANRMAMNYGKALGALLQEVWMFGCFCIFVLLYVGSINLKNILLLPIIFILLMTSSTIWGGLMNALFMFSRDASIIMNLFDTPMVLFSGTRIPTACFPIWAKVISMLFPLTYCLNIIRIALNVISGNEDWIKSFLKLILCLAIMMIITVMLLKKAEHNNRKTGELQFY